MIIKFKPLFRFFVCLIVSLSVLSASLFLTARPVSAVEVSDLQSVSYPFHEPATWVSFRIYTNSQYLYYFYIIDYAGEGKCDLKVSAVTQSSQTGTPAITFAFNTTEAIQSRYVTVCGFRESNMQFFQVLDTVVSGTNLLITDPYDAFTVDSVAFGNTNPNVDLTLDASVLPNNSEPHTVLFTGEIDWVLLYNLTVRIYGNTSAINNNLLSFINALNNNFSDLSTTLTTFFNNWQGQFQDFVDVRITAISAALTSIDNYVYFLYSRVNTINTNLVSFKDTLLAKLDELFGNDTPTAPPDSDTITEADRIEQDILGSVAQPGEDAVVVVVDDAKTGFNLFVSGFAVSSAVLSKFISPLPIQAIFNISLTFGVFALVVGAAPGVFRSFDRRSQSAKGGK